MLGYSLSFLLNFSVNLKQLKKKSSNFLNPINTRFPVAHSVGGHGSCCGTLWDHRPLWLVRIPTPPSTTRGPPRDLEPGRPAAQTGPRGSGSCGPRARSGVRDQRWCRSPAGLRRLLGRTRRRGPPPSSAPGPPPSCVPQVTPPHWLVHNETERPFVPAPPLEPGQSCPLTSLPGTESHSHGNRSWPPVQMQVVGGLTQGTDDAVISHRPASWRLIRGSGYPRGMLGGCPLCPPAPPCLAWPHGLPVTHPRGSLATSWRFPGVLGRCYLEEGAPGPQFPS